MSTRKRNSLIAAALAELTLKLAAAVDLHRRPAEQVRGPKRLWALLLLVNLFGPLAYFGFGRRK